MKITRPSDSFGPVTSWLHEERIRIDLIPRPTADSTTPLAQEQKGQDLLGFQSMTMPGRNTSSMDEIHFALPIY